MRRIRMCVCISLVILLSSVNVPAADLQNAVNFQGSWSDETAEELFFSLDLFQDGETLTGYHCGTTKNASRIDCSMEGEDVTISGTIQGATAKVRFTSAYSGQIGMARITHEGDRLAWEITAFPNGAYYLPDNAILTRTSITDETRQSSDTPETILRGLVSWMAQDENYPYEIKIEEDFIRYDDIDRDGIQDIIAIFRPVDEHIDEQGSQVRQENRFLAVGFVADVGEVGLMLWSQAVPCLECGGVYGEPEIGLETENGVISLSSYGGSTWRWEETQKIRYEQGKFKVIGYHEFSFHTAGFARFNYDLNLNTLEAVRRYEIGEGTDEKTGEARFRNIVAQKHTGPVTIDGKFDEADWQQTRMLKVKHSPAVIYKPENWSGASDLSFSVAALWDAEVLYLAVEVTDDQIVPVENWENLLKGDHLELWFDFADYLIAPLYEELNIRQKPDVHLSQIGVGLVADGPPLVRFFYPEKPQQNYGIIAASSRTTTGYRLEMQFPTALFQEFLPESFLWKDSQQFGLTVIVSDTDNPSQRKQDCLMATSEVKWGNPYTFGACYLFEQYEKPDFPLEGWRARY